MLRARARSRFGARPGLELDCRDSPASELLESPDRCCPRRYAHLPARDEGAAARRCPRGRSRAATPHSCGARPCRPIMSAPRQRNDGRGAGAAQEPDTCRLALRAHRCFAAFPPPPPVCVLRAGGRPGSPAPGCRRCRRAAGVRRRGPLKILVVKRARVHRERRRRDASIGALGARAADDRAAAWRARDERARRARRGRRAPPARAPGRARRPKPARDGAVQPHAWRVGSWGGRPLWAHARALSPSPHSGPPSPHTHSAPFIRAAPPPCRSTRQ
jgi:hypothetical protein